MRFIFRVYPILSTHTACSLHVCVCERGESLVWQGEMLREDASESSVERSSQLSRVRDSTMTLFQQYSELLRCCRAGGEVDQQVKQLRSAVLASGVVQSAQALLQLEDELRRGAVVAEHASIADEIAAVAAKHDAAASDGRQRLQRIVSEMQTSLRQMEDSYYSCTAPAEVQVDVSSHHT